MKLSKRARISDTDNNIVQKQKRKNRKLKTQKESSTEETSKGG